MRKLEVVMQCTYCRHEALVLILNSLADDVPVRCGSCSRSALISGVHEYELYRGIIKALIYETLKDGSLALALECATGMSAKIQSPFAISIRSAIPSLSERLETLAMHTILRVAEPSAGL